MPYNRQKPQIKHHHGQSLIEFALVLPLFVLLIVGIFDLGRAFFAFIAISNAAREGARVYTFDPESTTWPIIEHAISKELALSSVVIPANLSLPSKIFCVNPSTHMMEEIFNDTQLQACESEAPIRVTVSYNHALILSFFFGPTIQLERSAEMMVP
jgi:hypothetical protein